MSINKLEKQYGSKLKFEIKVSIHWGARMIFFQSAMAEAIQICFTKISFQNLVKVAKKAFMTEFNLGEAAGLKPRFSVFTRT